MRSRIADDLTRTDLDNQIDKAINRAIEHYEKDRFWFNEKVWTFSTVAAQETVAFATASTSDLLSVDLATLTRNSNDIYPIDPITFQEMRGINTTGTTSQGNPTLYALFNKTFYFYPVPNAVYTVSLYGQKSYAALASNTDTNDFLSEAEDLIEARARWWLYKRVIQDPDAAALAKEEELEALDALQAKNTQLVSTGKIKPND